jgi:general secretion pathway protein J
VGASACRAVANRGGRASQAGLSLLELLVSLALLGLLVLLLRDGFTLGHRVWERSGARLAVRIEAVEGVQTLLRERLTAINPAWRGEGDASRVLFEGTPQRMTFHARPPDTLGVGTWHRFALSMSSAGTLDLAWQPDTDTSPIAPWTSAVLLSGVTGAEFAYFGPTRTDPTGRWRDNWRGQELPPELIRLRVSFAPGDPRIWPDLLAIPRAKVDATCAFQPEARRCAGRS